MKYHRLTLPAISFLSFALAVVPHVLFANAESTPVHDNDDDNSHIIDDDDYDASTTCDANNNGVCQQITTDEETSSNDQTKTKTIKSSKVCPSSLNNQQEVITTPSSIIRNFYQQGISAQAYKPNAPMKTNVCEQKETVVHHHYYQQHKVAHGSIWRSTYNDVVPIVLRGNIYSCDDAPSESESSSSSNSSTNDDDVSITSSSTTVEVWQPRPDGTFSSLRPEVEEGECRATVPILLTSSKKEATTTNNDFSNFVGHFEFETLAPGSTGLLGGIIPPSTSSLLSRDYPPYGPGIIYMYLNYSGEEGGRKNKYHPSLVQLNMNELCDIMLQNTEEKDGSGELGRRFRFGGWDMRPHASSTSAAARNTIDDTNGGGMEVRTVKRVSRPGFDLALEVGVDLFLVSSGDTNSGNEEVGEDGGNVVGRSGNSHVFCSSHGLFGWISSFFKEPIAVCFPSLLDFFAL